MLTPNQKFAAARRVASRKMPYFSSVLYLFVPVPAPWLEVNGQPTIGCTKDLLLMINPKALEAWDIEEIAASLCHEVGHVVQDHHGRRGKREPGNWNIAGDLTINPLIRSAMPMPGEWAWPADLGLEEGKSADWYYEQLSKKGGPGKGKGQGQGNGNKLGKGHCGSCSGNPMEGEPQAGPSSKNPQPGKGQTPQGRSRRQIHQAARQVARDIKKQADKNPGSIPGGWAVWAEEQLAPPKVRWQDKLQRNLRRAISFGVGYGQQRYDRPARRQGLSVGPGHAVLPRQRKPKARVRVALDTSGSMTGEPLRLAISELHAILKSADCDVEFVACDTKTYGTKVVKSLRDARDLMKGGGGTDFRPIFQDVKQARPRPDVLVVMTDGCGPAPEVDPKTAHTIWLLVGDYVRRPAAFGDYIEIKEDNR